MTNPAFQPEPPPSPAISASKVVVFNWRLGSQPQTNVMVAFILSGLSIFFLVQFFVHRDPDETIVCLLPTSSLALIFAGLAIQDYWQIRKLRAIPEQPEIWRAEGLVRPASECTWFSEERDESTVMLGYLLRLRVAWLNGWRPPNRQKLARLRQELIHREFTQPLILIQKRYAKEIRQIEMRSELIEPEPIVSLGDRWSTGLNLVALLVVLLVLSGFWVMTHFWAFPLIAIYAIAACLMSTQPIKAWLRPNPRGRIAAPGVVQQGEEAAFASPECVTIIYRCRQRLRVLILGPNERCLTLHFASAQDPGFIEFWQRWNHPHPRPELMSE